MKTFIQNHDFATAGTIVLLLKEIEDRMILDEDFKIEIKVLKKLIKFSSNKTVNILETILKNHNIDILKNINNFDERFEEETIKFLFNNDFSKVNFTKQQKLFLIDSKLEFNNLQSYFHENVKNLILNSY